MNRMEINKLFTDKVTEYIAEGYVINSNSMGGTQGEVAKVDLVKGKTLLRVWLNKESIYSWDDATNKFHGNVMVLRVGKWKKNAREVISNSWSTVWMDDCETIYQQTFYEVRHNSDYYVSMDEAIAAQKVRKDRRQGRDYSPDKRVWYRNEVARNAAYNYLRRKVGYKRLKWEDIEVLKIITTKEAPIFYVVYHGTRYKMV